MMFAEAEFDDQEWISFETLRKSPIAKLPKIRFTSHLSSSHHSTTPIDPSLPRVLRSNRNGKVTGTVINA